MSDDVVNFLDRKAAVTTTIEMNGEQFDLDAWLVQRG
jgi:hypothetical protein